jgi:hypothetical protein
MGKPKLVTLVCTTAGLPYYPGDIFSVESSVANKILDKAYKGNLRVRKFDAKKDADLLLTQRGKAGDVATAEEQEAQGIAKDQEPIVIDDK